MLDIRFILFLWLGALETDCMEPASATNFVNNLLKIMRIHGLTQTQLAKKAGVAQKTINNIINMVQRPNIETVDMVAQAFGMEGWHMIMPVTEEELMEPVKIEKVIQSYRSSSTEGKQHIFMVAEREAHYGSDH